MEKKDKEVEKEKSLRGRVTERRLTLKDQHKGGQRRTPGLLPLITLTR